MEESRIDRQLTSNPWKSLPVDDLLSGGFVRPDGDGSAYYAPDADVLLSDAFLDTHCMRLADGENDSEGLIGLAFEPVGDRGITEISGVLWVDPSNGELRWLDYGYEYLDVPNRERLGGRVRFEGLPDGTWIVRDWVIRMPLLSATRLRTGGLRTELIGIKEQGGLIVRVSDTRNEIVLDSRAGIVEGVVLDSAGAGPVSGAVVLLDDTDRATTDEEGRFRFSSLPAGNYGLRVSNPALDVVGLGAPVVYVESVPGEVSTARLMFPGVVDALTEMCGPHEPRAGGGIMTGHLLQTSGDPAPGARISIRWQEVRALAGGFQRQDLEAQVAVERYDGSYAACGLPRDRWLEIVVEWEGRETRPERWRFPGMTVVVKKDLTVTPGGP